MTKSEEQHLSLQKALQQCELVQNMIDISISSLEGLRTKCATSNDLTQKEIRTLEVSTVIFIFSQCTSFSINTPRAVTVLFLGHSAYVYMLLLFFSPAGATWNCGVTALMCKDLSSQSPLAICFFFFCGAVNQEATGLQWAVRDLRILQVAGREGGSPPSE